MISPVLLLLVACFEEEGSSENPVPRDAPNGYVDEPDIRVDASRLDFGTVEVGCTPEPVTLTIVNQGTAMLEVDVEVPSPWRGSPRHQRLQPGDRFEVTLRFDPTVGGAAAETLRVRSNDPDQPTVEVALTGSAVAPDVTTDTWTQELHDEVDLLWVIDNSCSMADHLASLALAHDGLIRALLALNIDYRIGVVTTDMVDPDQSGALLGPVLHPTTSDPVGEFQAQVAAGANGSAFERPLDAALAALTPPLSIVQNVTINRPGVPLAVVVVTDEDDSSDVSVTDFVDALDAMRTGPASTSLSAVSGPDRSMFACATGGGGIASPAPTLHQVQRATGGVHVNICADPYDIIGDLLATPITGLRSAFPVDPDIDVSTLVVTLDGQPTIAYTVDSPNDQVLLSARPATGTEVALTYALLPVCD